MKLNGEDWSLAQKVTSQEAILGVSVSTHPLELAGPQLTELGAVTTVAAAARFGEKVRVAGIRQTWRRFSSAYILALEDLEGMLDVFISSDLYRKHRTELSSTRPLVIEGPIELDRARGEPILRAEGIWSL